MKGKGVKVGFTIEITLKLILDLVPNSLAVRHNSCYVDDLMEDENTCKTARAFQVNIILDMILDMIGYFRTLL